MTFDIDYIHSIIEQAKQYLMDFGEFFPFGYILNNQRETRLVSVYFDDEFPSSKRLIEELENTLRNDLTNRECLCAAICADVLVENKSISESKFNAIQIRLQNVDRVKVDLFISYKPTGKSYEYLDAYEANGTLDLIE